MFDNSVHSAGEYRALHDPIASDELPRFESQFKTYLNTNTIRDIAGFHSQLTKQVGPAARRVDAPARLGEMLMFIVLPRW